MKTSIFLIALTSLVLLFSCTQHKTDTINLNGLKPGKHIYQAGFEKDSATLHLDVAANGRITGDLKIRFTKPGDTVEVNTGTIVGEFRGDTLFADYSFTSISKYKNVYINPIALLHKGDTLTMGAGRIMTYLGRNYLDPQTPINFTKVKFKFMQVR